ncbi:MAG: J domain-containing protein [Candidatus Rokubacteria bacterium]|nr:J domain-containing protein [Candidatus Rokubacteria bacterium]
MRDYYAVLGITTTAGPREIRQAFRRLARQYSPDVNFWDEQAESLFQEIAEAYRILSDPAARAMYDRFGDRTMPMGLGAGRRGDDVHATVSLAFAEAARGATLAIDVPRFSPCDRCGATGNVAGAACAPCRGRGVARAVDRVRFDVPAGVDAGTQVRVRGEGSAGPFGGPRGDLVVSTRVEEHPFFTRKGDNVHCEVPISVWEALRGTRIRIPTPTGEATVVVPPGTTGQQVFRLRGEGLSKLSGDGHGDLFVTIHVEMPRGLDTRTEELIRELERLVPLEPRTELARFRGGES